MVVPVSNTWYLTVYSRISGCFYFLAITIYGSGKFNCLWCFAEFHCFQGGDDFVIWGRSYDFIDRRYERIRIQNFLFHFPFDEIYRRLLFFTLRRSVSA